MPTTKTETVVAPKEPEPRSAADARSDRLDADQPTAPKPQATPQSAPNAPTTPADQPRPVPPKDVREMNGGRLERSRFDDEARHLWPMFAAAALASGKPAVAAANQADSLIREWRNRHATE